jgi:hypothetical protein
MTLSTGPKRWKSAAICGGGRRGGEGRGAGVRAPRRPLARPAELARSAPPARRPHRPRACRLQRPRRPRWPRAPAHLVGRDRRRHAAVRRRRARHLRLLRLGRHVELRPRDLERRDARHEARAVERGHRGYGLVAREHGDSAARERAQVVGVQLQVAHAAVLREELQDRLARHAIGHAREVQLAAWAGGVRVGGVGWVRGPGRKVGAWRQRSAAVTAAARARAAPWRCARGPRARPTRRYPAGAWRSTRSSGRRPAAAAPGRQTWRLRGLGGGGGRGGGGRPPVGRGRRSAARFDAARCRASRGGVLDGGRTPPPPPSPPPSLLPARPPTRAPASALVAYDT